MLDKFIIILFSLYFVIGYPYPFPFRYPRHRDHDFEDHDHDDKSSLESNKSCLLSSFSKGVCRSILKCPIALEMLEESNKHNLPRCGFRDRVEIVCCPITSTRISTGSTSSTTRGTTSTTTVRPTRTTTVRPMRTTVKPTRFNTDWIVSPDIIDSFTTSTTTTERAEFRENENGGNGNDGDDEDTRIGTVRVGTRSTQACLEYNNEVSLELQFNILGGTNATLGEFPHMAAINYEYDGEDHFNCGGSLISDRYVLTAAHCILRTDNRKPTKVRLGKIDLLERNDNADPQDYVVEDIIVHPEYRSTQHYNDIALLRLRDRVRYNKNVYPACLYTNSTVTRGLVVTGWGITDVLQGDPSQFLKKATLELVDQTQCNDTYAPRPDRRLTRGIVKSQLCASGERVRDACEGDSGGPIQVQSGPTNNMWYVVGVTSFGVSCGSRYPGVYARVSEYLDWIERNVWQN